MIHASPTSRLSDRPVWHCLLLPTVWLTAVTVTAVVLDAAGTVPDSVLQASALALALRVGYIFLRA